MKRVLTLLAAAAAVQGCATVSGTSEIVSVDSEPRGVEVYSSASAREALGVTPLFLEERRARSHTYYLEGPNGDRTARSMSCRLRWAPTFIGDGLAGLFFVAASPLAGLGALVSTLSVDFLDGAAYDCGGRRQLAADWGAAPPPKRCRRYLIAPPAYWDERVSDGLAREWIVQARKSLKGCSEFVKPERAKELFAFLNVDHAHPTAYADLGERNVRNLGLETGATDLVILKPDVTKGTARLTASIFDLHTGERDRTPPPVARVKLTGDAAPDQTATGRATIIRSFQMLPNSISYSLLTSDSITYAAKPEYSVPAPTRHDSLPRYLTSWGASSVDHPDGFGVWDIHVHLYPGFTTGYIDESFSVIGPKASADAPLTPSTSAHEYDLSFFYLAAVMNAAITFHTPMGALSPNAGLGAAAFVVQDTFENVTALEPVGKLGVSYVAFLTQNIFVRANYDYYSIVLDTALLNNVVLSISSFQVASLGLGYFFPQIRSYARKML